MATSSPKLIICEKPTACVKIAKILDESGKPKKLIKKVERNKVTFYKATRNSEDLIIVSGIGHLFTVERKDEENKWEYPFWDTKWLASYKKDKKAKNKKVFIDFIKKLSKNCTIFINACDYDLEGSIIGFNILKFCCPQKSVELAKRMKFSTLTQKGILESYNNLLPNLNFNLVEAGLTRHEVDFIYGINLSTALVSAIKKADLLKFYLLSIGRVQGPTLSFVEERERQIQSFVPQPYWTINGRVKINSKHFDIKYSQKRISFKKKAEKIISECKNKQGTIQQIETRKMTRNPPNPFNLSSLQSDSYKFFGYTPSKTLKISEGLYLSGLISYPRTSNQIIPPDIDVKAILKSIKQSSKYSNLANKILSKKQLVPTKGKKTDPAHPPILPTGDLPKSKLKNNEEKIYELIVRRFFAIFADPAKIKSIKTHISVNGHIFYLRGRQILEEGWLKFYPYSKSKEILLPKLTKGQRVTISINLNDKFDQAPSRLNPNSLRKFMENKEIGTKATRANIIDILNQRGYFTYFLGKKIEITDIGIEVVRTLRKYCPEILSTSLTRQLEKEMEEIEQAKRTREDILLSVRNTLGPILDKFKDKEKEIGEFLAAAALKTIKERRVLGKCNKCGDGNLIILRSKTTKKRFIGCSNHPDCSNSFPIAQRGKITPIRGKFCKICYEKFNVKYPIYRLHIPGTRPFYGCVNWTNHPKKQPRSSKSGKKAKSTKVTKKKKKKQGKKKNNTKKRNSLKKGKK